MDASLFLLPNAACAEALGNDATEEDAAAAYWLDDGFAAAAEAAFDL